MVSPYVLIRATRKGIYLAANAEVDGYITLTFLNKRSSDEPLELVTIPDIYPDSSDTNPCYLLPQSVGTENIPA